MHSSPRPRYRSLGIRLVALPLALSLLGAGSGPSDLSAARSRIVRAMAGGQADYLHPLLPRSSKVFLQLREIREARGYFGANQVVKVFEDFFARNASAGFTLLENGHPEDQTSIQVRGKLRLAHGHNGDQRSLILTFVLTREPEGWTIREVREGS